MHDGGSEDIVSLPPLANAELAVMELLWKQDRLTARQLREQLYPSARKAQHGTLQRLLQPLEDKEFVARDVTLTVVLFSESLSRQGHTSGQLEALTEKLTGGCLASLIRLSIEARGLTRAEIEKLQLLLAESKQSEVRT